MSRNLRMFAGFSVLWAAAYAAVLYYQLLRWTAPVPVITSVFVVFLVLLTSVEGYLKRNDNQRAVRYSLRARYSGISAAASSAVTAVWIVAWRHRLWLAVALGLAAVVTVILVAWLSGQEKIKGIPREQLFP